MNSWNSPPKQIASSGFAPHVMLFVFGWSDEGLNFFCLSTDVGFAEGETCVLWDTASGCFELKWNILSTAKSQASVRKKQCWAGGAVGLDEDRLGNFTSPVFWSCSLRTFDAFVRL